MPDRPPFPPGASDVSSPSVEVASLAGLRRALEDPGYAAVCFVGPSGQARADLLYALADALHARCRLVYLRGTALPPGGFWMRVADALELASGYDARRRVLRLAGDLSRTGQALLFVLDDAQALPADTLYAVLATARSQPGLLVVLAHSAGERLAGPMPEDVALILSAEPAGALAPAAELTGTAPHAPAAYPPVSEEAAAVSSAAPHVFEAPAEAPPPAESAVAGDGPMLAALTLDGGDPLPSETFDGAAAGRAAAAPPWEVPLDAPVRSPRRAARERRRERRRRIGWGASGLALGLLLAATIDIERLRPLAVGLLEGVARIAPPRPPPRAAEPPSPFARNAPPDDAASAPTAETGVATPAPPTPDVAAPPPGGPAAAPLQRQEPDASTPRLDTDTAAPRPEAAAPAPEVSPPGVDPQGEAQPVSDAAHDAAPSPEAAAPPGVPSPAVAPPPGAPSALAAPRDSLPAAAPAALAPDAPAPEPAPRAAAPPSVGAPAAAGAGAEPSPPPAPPRPRGPLALGALSVAADAPVWIEIDGESFGPAPLAGLRLPGGEHRILARLPDGSVAQKTIVLGERDLAVAFRVR